MLLLAKYDNLIFQENLISFFQILRGGDGPMDATLTVYSSDKLNVHFPCCHYDETLWPKATKGGKDLFDSHFQVT